MKLVNLDLRFTPNNIFVVIVQVLTDRIIQTQTLGKLGFINCQKRLFETFKIILAATLDYLSLHCLKINLVKLNRIDPSKFKLIKKQFQNLQINEIIITQSIKHNGCRRKSLARRRSRGLKLGKFKL
jgi:hypothetical protein